MNLNDIKEIGILYNAKIENTRNKQIEKRDLIIFIFNDNSTHYLDISAGKELEIYEKVIGSDKTKLNKIYKNQNMPFKEIKAEYPNYNLTIENLNDIKEIGILYNTKIENTPNKQIEKRNLIIFIFNDNSTHYLDISAGKELEVYEKVIGSDKTKLNKIYKNQDMLFKEFKAEHPNYDLNIENRYFKSQKKKGKK